MKPRIDFLDLCIAMGFVLIVVMSICLASCTTDESTRSLRSITITHTDGSGSFDLAGGWKTSNDVWRGGMGGDLDVHAWSIGWSPFAYLPDPDSAATRAALERVLRARETPYVDPCGWECPTCKSPLK